MLSEPEAALKSVEAFNSAFYIEQLLILHHWGALVLPASFWQLLQQLHYCFSGVKVVVGLSDLASDGASVNGCVRSQMFIYDFLLRQLLEIVKCLLILGIIPDVQQVVDWLIFRAIFNHPFYEFSLNKDRLRPLLQYLLF